MKKLQEYLISKEYLIQKLGRYIQRGHIYRLQFPANQLTKLKQLGLVSYNDKKGRYQIDLELYNEMKGELLLEP